MSCCLGSVRALQPAALRSGTAQHPREPALSCASLAPFEVPKCLRVESKGNAFIGTSGKKKISKQERSGFDACTRTAVRPSTVHAWQVPYSAACGKRGRQRHLPRVTQGVRNKAKNRSQISYTPVHLVRCQSLHFLPW